MDFSLASEGWMIQVNISLGVIDEFRNGKEKGTPTTSVVFANEELLFSQSLTRKAVFILFYFPNVQ